ncbi:hypothetical protein EYF80_023828 [Liparis tanakae]|uniref:Uncharacterized protein n=1 Tax=Liparis tanakae TaxID=230148 RepID=A0A4Z2HKX6_9TELE|nr:hypothetical protein EYF80_023828 [Liparis tanakae]
MFGFRRLLHRRFTSCTIMYSTPISAESKYVFVIRPRTGCRVNKLLVSRYNHEVSSIKLGTGHPLPRLQYMSTFL